MNSATAVRELSNLVSEAITTLRNDAEQFPVSPNHPKLQGVLSWGFNHIQFGPFSTDVKICMMLMQIGAICNVMGVAPSFGVEAIITITQRLQKIME